MSKELIRNSLLYSFHAWFGLSASLYSVKYYEGATLAWMIFLVILLLGAGACAKVEPMTRQILIARMESASFAKFLTNVHVMIVPVIPMIVYFFTNDNWFLANLLPPVIGIMSGVLVTVVTKGRNQLVPGS